MRGRSADGIFGSVCILLTPCARRGGCGWSVLSVVFRFGLFRFLFWRAFARVGCFERRRVAVSCILSCSSALLVFQQRAASPSRRPDASASTLPILRASSPAPCPQASCCSRSARRGFAVSGVGPRSYRILDGSSLDDCRSARDGATCSWVAHPYTAAQAFLPGFLFIVVV